MLGKRYSLDRENLIFKQLKLSFKQKLGRLAFVLSVSLVLGALYGLGFKEIFGSPKELRLENELEMIRNSYSLLENDFLRLDNALKNIAAVENNTYRPVLGLDTLPETFRKSGFGGSRKYDELEGYQNSDIMTAAMKSLNELQRKTYVQSKSFEEIIPVAESWKHKLDHIPFIQPVMVGIPLGEGVRYRDDHPVLHVSRWHYGQDFRSPVGTDVFATGAGVVTKAAWTPYGFGNRIEIDHGYGYKTIYGHLSAFNVKKGDRVQRGDLIGLSGSSGISSGPHLHYEVHLNGRIINPLFFFNDDLSSSEYQKMIKKLEADTAR